MNYPLTGTELDLSVSTWSQDCAHLHPASIEAAEHLLKERARVAHQIMEDIKAQYMPIVLNDDDWYIFDTLTLELIQQVGSKWPEYAVKEITTGEQTALRGLAIKLRGIELWQEKK
jgi:predicted RNase H-like nuclease